MSAPVLMPQVGAINPRWRVGDRVVVHAPNDPISDRKWDIGSSPGLRGNSSWAASVKGFHGNTYTIHALHRGPSFTSDPCATLDDTDGAAVPVRWLVEAHQLPPPSPPIDSLYDLYRAAIFDRDQARAQCGEARAERDRLRHDPGISEPALEQALVQLTGCFVAADCHVAPSGRMKQGDYGWSPAFEAVKKLRADYELYRHAERNLSGQVAELTDERDTLIRAAKARESRPWVGRFRDRVTAETMEASALVATFAWFLVLIGAAFSILLVDRLLCAASWIASVATRATRAQIDTAKPFSVVGAAIGVAVALYVSSELRKGHVAERPLLRANDPSTWTVPVQDRVTAPVQTTSTTRRWF